MNEYRITYTDKSGSKFYCNITERTEAAAKKSFNTWGKSLGHTFQGAELLRTDACATKQQERDTLEIIRKMVEELGPQSYIATAFDGCFEDAESNIDNDFGDSMARRWKYSESQLKFAKDEVKALKEELEESKKDWEAAHAANHELADQKDAEIAALQAQVLSPDDLEDIRQLLDDRATVADERAEEAATEIVKLADDPTSPEFRQAVLDNRNYAKEADYYREILSRIVKVQATYHAGA